MYKKWPPFLTQFVCFFKIKNAPPIEHLLTYSQPLQKLYESASHKNILRLANISSNPNHALNTEYNLLPSNGRYRVPTIRKVRLKHSLVHQSILELNQALNPRCTLINTSAFRSLRVSVSDAFP